MNRREIAYWLGLVGRWERQGLPVPGFLFPDPNPFPKIRLFRWLP